MFASTGGIIIDNRRKKSIILERIDEVLLELVVPDSTLLHAKGRADDDNNIRQCTNRNTR